MVAVAHLPQAAHRPLVVVRSTPVRHFQPQVAPAATYRRRRAVALAAVASAVVALLVAVQSLLGALGGGTATVPERPAVSGPVHVVQPGDTFWDIARALRPDDDPRALVARLVAAHGSPVLVAGERLALPAAA